MLSRSTPKKKAANPFPGDYEPELDTTPTLNPELLSWYASLIGMLRWMLEIGRVDIITEVLKSMASQMALPREGPSMRSCTFLVSCESTTILGWRTTHLTPPST
jgi:hypothetical protein